MHRVKSHRLKKGMNTYGTAQHPYISLLGIRDSENDFRRTEMQVPAAQIPVCFLPHSLSYEMSQLIQLERLMGVIPYAKLFKYMV